MLQADYHIGIHYRDGRWVMKDNNKANYWFDKVKNSGLIDPELLPENLSIREPDDVQLYVAN